MFDNISIFNKNVFSKSVIRKSPINISLKNSISDFPVSYVILKYFLNFIKTPNFISKIFFKLISS